MSTSGPDGPLVFLFRSPDPKFEKNSRKSTDKKIWPYLEVKVTDLEFSSLSF